MSLVIDRLIKSDPNVFSDFIKTLSHTITHPSTNNIFLPQAKMREENLNRAKNIKRLAFLIYSGDHDQYTEHLPLIQEKLGDALKAKGDPETISHIKQYVFLVLRVILFRCTQKKIDSFWPVVLTEMMDIFSNHIQDSQLVLEVTKFLDILLVLPTEFNLWQWIFIRDQFVSPPVGKSNLVDNSSGGTCFVPFFERFAQKETEKEECQFPKRTKQRPLVTSEAVSLFESARLLDFLTKFGDLSYNNSVSASGSEPDYPYLEQLLAQEFCEKDSIEKGWLDISVK